MVTSLKMRCKKCVKILKISVDSIGKKIKCPHCKTTMIVPDITNQKRRTSARALIEESNFAADGADKPDKSTQEPLFKIMYTEVDPIQFALKRKEYVPILDLSENGLSFLIQGERIKTPFKFKDVITLEIDFPILVEPLTIDSEVRWMKPMEDADDLLQIGVTFLSPTRRRQEMIDNMINYVLSRPEAWAVDD